MPFGMVNSGATLVQGYYRDHIPACAEISARLSDLKKGMSEQVQWNEAQERAYSLLMGYLLQAS